MRATIGLAALSTTATAIMIPSTVSVPELSSVSETSLKAFGMDPKSQLMKVDCAGCMFAQKDGSDRLTWSQGIENALVLNISVGAQPETLELNGVRFYPPLMNFAIENPVPYIPQVPADMSLVDIKAHSEELAKDALRLTSWAFQAGTSQTVSESGEEILTIHLQLNALERQSITVPDITLTVLKNTDGELMLMKIEEQDKEQVEKQECEDWPLLCKWKSIIADKLSGFKDFKPHFGAFGKAPCDGAEKEERPDGKHPWKFHGPPGDHEHKPGHGGPPGWKHHGPPPGWKHHGPPGWKHHGPPGKHGHHGPPHGWHHGHHHMHHGKFAAAMHTVGRVMLTVFVPVLLGVAAGMVTYLLGMMIGAVVAAVYMKIRGRKTKYQAVALDEEEYECEYPDDETPRSSMEKDGFKVEEAVDAPPVYVEKE